LRLERVSQLAVRFQTVHEVVERLLHAIPSCALLQFLPVDFGMGNQLKRIH
jgi:hypothetical protein